MIRFLWLINQQDQKMLRISKTEWSESCSLGLEASVALRTAKGACGTDSGN
jgi:hypothetical protein